MWELWGKSGCGKTTLLKVLGTIDFATDGKLFLHGQDIDKLYDDRLADIRRKEIGFIFQDFYLMNSLSGRGKYYASNAFGQSGYFCH